MATFAFCAALQTERHTTVYWGATRPPLIHLPRLYHPPLAPEISRPPPRFLPPPHLAGVARRYESAN